MARTECGAIPSCRSSALGGGGGGGAEVEGHKCLDVSHLRSSVCSTQGTSKSFFHVVPGLVSMGLASPTHRLLL